MGRLIYLINTSLDGYVADRDGNLNWGAPSGEVFNAILELHDTQREDAVRLAHSSGLRLVFSHEDAPVSPSNRARGVTLTWLVLGAE